MYGITITENGKVTAQPGDITYRNIVCRDHMIRKFERDKVFAETYDYIILLDGVVLNRRLLIDEYKRTCKVADDSMWGLVLLSLYAREGERFFASLRGGFAGVNS